MDDVTTYADEHEGGQLRIACTGEQVPLLGLPDSAIPTVRCRAVAELLGDPLAELTPAALATIRGQTELGDEAASYEPGEDVDEWMEELASTDDI